MTSEFSVNLDHLDQVVARLNGLAGFLHNHLDGLDRKVANLTNGSWESTAATAYANAHTQWAASAKEFADGVAEMSDAARTAHSSYTTAGNLNGGISNGCP